MALGSGYPGTPSTEILENFARYGGRAQWSPNEKTALEVCIGAAYGGGRALATMKHVGLNVAADPLFTVAYTGVTGALVVVTADDPGMASSQNEQDNRRYAVAAGLPMLEPSDSQEAYDFFGQAIELSERWRIPVLFRVTTRVCHSKSVVRPATSHPAPPEPRFVRDVRGRVMIPAYARLAHRRLRQKLTEIAAWNETGPLNSEHRGGKGAGDHHGGSQLSARAGRGTGSERVEIGNGVSAAAGADPGVCGFGGPLFRAGRGRSVPGGRIARGGDCGRGQGGDVSVR